ncbi:MAG: guanine-specific ribonuclease N1 and T1 [Betaproteobacteria bacterium]|nr:guanine-specific ribonuclease N1 and T1 [Betaproteobacteria bacterium]NBY71203.1 guanine-specific ribonuclease N1 and T1 [Betaproteobacteria bacterium]NDD12408.1 guanine-specific ribonuclease N1 and T1 [Betaproteobacteria bacterium]
MWVGKVQRKTSIKLVLTGLLWLTVQSGLGLGFHVANAREQATTSLPSIAWAELPEQGRVTYLLVLKGGPFPYEKDGVTFGNRERLLPQAQRGYYREYTVPTPGAPNRGVRRLVCGGEAPQPKVCYYTADHYASFRQVVPGN